MVGGASQDLLLARTGYTGEDGFEIFVSNDDAAALWQALVAIAEDGELTPAGLASRDSLRLEAGMPLYGNELSLEGDPFAAGLGPVVALSKEGDFVGKAALAAKKEAGAGTTTGRKLVGLKGLGRRAGRGHYPVLKDGNTVGEVTSGQPSPTLGYPVAMAYVDVEFTEPGTGPGHRPARQNGAVRSCRTAVLQAPKVARADPEPSRLRGRPSVPDSGTAGPGFQRVASCSLIARLDARFRKPRPAGPSRTAHLLGQPTRHTKTNRKSAFERQRCWRPNRLPGLGLP